jgi:hypothetical protein
LHQVFLVSRFSAPQIWILICLLALFNSVQSTWHMCSVQQPESRRVHCSCYWRHCLLPAVKQVEVRVHSFLAHV